MAKNNYSHKYSYAELAKEVRREIELRRGLYPRFIKSGRLTEEKAAQQIEMMEQIYDLFERITKDECAVVWG